MRLSFLAACGRSERALADVESVAKRAETAGDAPTLIEARAVQLALPCKRGEGADAAAAEQLVATAREAGEPQLMASAFVAAAELMLASGDSERARALLEQ